MIWFYYIWCILQKKIEVCLEAIFKNNFLFLKIKLFYGLENIFDNFFTMDFLKTCMKLKLLLCNILKNKIHRKYSKFLKKFIKKVKAFHAF